jgi:hypothetical protein
VKKEVSKKKEGTKKARFSRFSKQKKENKQLHIGQRKKNLLISSKEKITFIAKQNKHQHFKNFIVSDQLLSTNKTTNSKKTFLFSSGRKLFFKPPYEARCISDKRALKRFVIQENVMFRMSQSPQKLVQ